MRVGKSENHYDILIIGGSVAGMSAALSLAWQAKEYGLEPKIGIVEKNAHLGKKLLATGNGRCNINNIHSDYHDEAKKICDDIGLFLTEPDSQGRIYPYTMQAKTVVDTFLRAMDRYNIKIISRTQAIKIEVGKESEFITTIQTISYIKKGKGNKERYIADLSNQGDKKKLISKKLILATGGKAGPIYGSTGEGLDLAQSLGHSIIKPIPSLCPLAYSDSSKKRFSNLSGLRVKAQVSIYNAKSKLLYEEIGEVQFRDDSISGICIFNASSFYEKGSFIVIDLFPNIEKNEILEILSYLDKGGSHKLEGILDQRLCDLLYKSIGSKKAYAQLIALAKQLKIELKGLGTYSEAQVSKGGVPLSEVNGKTFESNKAKNLYLVGEILDYSGLCGGYNLSFAIASGSRVVA
jgi:predicted flavoprotein YhiN